MAEPLGQERTESATPRRRQEAREKGQVARSREVNTVFVLGAGLLALHLWGSLTVDRLMGLFRWSAGAMSTLTLTPATVSEGAGHLALYMGVVLAPLVLPVMLAGVAADLAQGGLVWSGHPLQPQWGRVNPATGIRRLFAGRSLVELLKSVLKILVVGLAAWSALRPAFPRFLMLPSMEPGQLLAFAASLVMAMGIRVLAALALLAAADTLFQRWEFGRSLRMTRQELKEEYRQSEGDPLLRQRVRSRQLEVSRRRMMREVPKADVVVTNPVHLAVALRYDGATMAAPRVVAMGQRLIAERIRELARENGVPVVEDPPLAWALFRSTKVGGEVPVALFRAVAELLAVAYRRRGRDPFTAPGAGPAEGA